MIENGRDLKLARETLGFSLTEMADELRMGRRGPDYLRDIESMDPARERHARLSGPMAIAVECKLKERGYAIEDGRVIRL